MYSNHVQQGHNPVQLHNTYTNHMPNGHPQLPNGSSIQPPASHRAPMPQTPKEVINVQAIPSVTVQNNQLIVGDSQSTSTRSYTPLKVVGDGSFGTVWLCDWHGTLPPNTPLSAMQCGAGARPEYAGKRLVAVKRMKKRWEGGWDECKKLKELESLRAIPYHPNIIPLYDFFLLPTTKELYFVFESMEGNLYQLIKTRKGKPLAGGLVSSIFRQVVSGLHHIHASGYFHRDMKPENLLVTTTGLYDYRSLSPVAPPDAPLERDVVVIIKLADFGLARETKSKPPYTEYVSTRWYRAPEVLLKSRDYSNPVDMWALGTIMAELVNLRPLFPGQGEIDQVARICELLGDPCDDYGLDARGSKWAKGVKMAKAVGFAFQKVQPKNIYSLFDRSVPIKLVDCIADLLKYDPDVRLTSRQCVDHPYLLETTPLNNPPGPPTQPTQFPSQGRPQHRNGVSPSRSLPSVPPRNAPPSHSHAAVSHRMDFDPYPSPAVAHIPDASSSHRTSFYDTSSSRTRAVSETSVYGIDVRNPIIHSDVPPADRTAQPAYPYDIDQSSNGWASSFTSGPPGDWDAMDVSPQVEIPADPQDIQTSPMVREHPSRPPVEPDTIQDNARVHAQEVSHSHGSKFGKAFSFGKKPNKWGLGGMFGHGDKDTQHALPPVQEVVGSASSTPSLKRTQSSSTDSRSLSELSPVGEVPPRAILDPKQRKKEAEKMQRAAEKQRHLLADKMAKEQARAVMEKKKMFLDHDGFGTQFEWLSANPVAILHGANTHAGQGRKGKEPASPDAEPWYYVDGHYWRGGGSFSTAAESSHSHAHSRGDWRRDERVPKARRREFDDDHSMSSSDMQSGMSVISFATVDSDPGPARLRHRPSAMGISRITSMSSLRPSSIDEYSPHPHGRSSTSLGLEQQLVNDFHLRASVDSSSLSDGGSPPPAAMQMLSLSSPIPWQPRNDSSSQTTVDSASVTSRRPQYPPVMTLSIPPAPRHPQPSPYEPGGQIPASPGLAPKSAINPIFKVPPLPNSVGRPGSLTSLPPFSQLEAVAEGEYPPLSPMSFTSPEDIANDFS
ncbi:Serine/threonine-protein kinase MAK [Grifola frondosa]|uniref:Serine/threonine-protein kinase MAK n=1 Tax=Grifola frondosa TaxID=5627 RepID=A0A1C7MS59_GRIFR|nr:Serine/threonine-protein kinase MAK [Grifola frondosa]